MEHEHFDLQMSPRERGNCTFLVCEENPGKRNSLKTSLRNLGFNNVSDAGNLSQGLKKLELRPYSHVLFQARKSDITSQEFIERGMIIAEEAVFIPHSSQPTVDDVFSLLIAGARGYLVTPFRGENVERTVLQATLGDPLPEELLMAKDRNEALIAITMTNLDKLATTLRQAKKFDSAKKQLAKEMGKLRSMAHMAKVFAEGGDEGFISSLQKFAEKRGNAPATKLGRLRKRLSNSRGK